MDAATADAVSIGRSTGVVVQPIIGRSAVYHWPPITSAPPQVGDRRTLRWKAPHPGNDRIVPNQSMRTLPGAGIQHRGKIGRDESDKMSAPMESGLHLVRDIS